MSVVLNETDLSKALDKVQAYMAASEKTDDGPTMQEFEALQYSLRDRDGEVGEHLDSVYAQLENVRQGLYALDSDRAKDRKTMLKLAQRLYDLIQQAKGKDIQDDASPYQGAATMAKSLFPTASRPVQIALTRKVIEWFGPKGGQQVAYDRELCAKMRLHKSITLDEEKRWRQYGLLHDRVDITNPKAMPQQEYYAPPTQAASFVNSLCPLMQSHLARKLGL